MTDPAAESQDHNASQGTTTGQPASPSAPASQLARAKVTLKSCLQQYQDFPSPGILFEDIMPLFSSPTSHALLIDTLCLFIDPANGGPGKPDVVVGLEARGFLFGPSLALRIGAGFVPIRKKGKLPGDCETAAYKKEYGEDLFQIQKGTIGKGQKVLIVDDIIATGGTAVAAGQLVKQVGGDLIGYVFMLELDFLKGRAKLDAPAYTLLSSQEDMA